MRFYHDRIISQVKSLDWLSRIKLWQLIENEMYAIIQDHSCAINYKSAPFMSARGIRIGIILSVFHKNIRDSK